MIKRIIVDPSDVTTMVNREHVAGYLHALEEITIMLTKCINSEVTPSMDNSIKTINLDEVVDILDVMRIKAARDLGRFELSSHDIWMED